MLLMVEDGGGICHAIHSKLPVNGFKWIEDVKYPKKLHDLHSDLPFLPRRMKIDKCEKLVCNLHSKKKYVVHIKSLKQALDHGLKFKKY